MYGAGDQSYIRHQNDSANSFARHPSLSYNIFALYTGSIRTCGGALEDT